jgi:outer membrane protein assembly factor BamB
MWQKTKIILAVIMMSSTLFAGISSAQELEFKLPEAGGAMAHCDSKMSDYINMSVPTENVHVVWHHDEKSGEKSGSKGLGFSSNGDIAAATFTGLENNLIIYDYDGNRLWLSGKLLNALACASAPIIDVHGRVIACDNKVVLMVDPLDADEDGVILEWKSKLIHGGLPISPVILEDGTLFIATKGGPLYIFDSANGQLLGTKFLYKEDDEYGFFLSLFMKYTQKKGYYETINTPCIKGNRVYISTQYNKDLFKCFRRGRLYAIDIDCENPNKNDRLQISWYYDFNGPSGASPLLIDDTLYFDAERCLLRKPGIISIIDKGDTWEEKWKSRIPNPIDSSLAFDPRGGFWIVDAFGGRLIRKSTENGGTLDIINTDKIVNKPGTHKPCSVITICGSRDRPILINAVMSLNPIQSSCYVIAVDLEDDNNLLWKVKISEGAIASLDFPFGQYPVLIKNGKSRLVFTTVRGGAWAIGHTNSP